MGSSAADERRDTETRRLAQTDFAKPLLLEAGAGTGKTAVLVARIVAWCLGPGWERAAASESRGAGDAAIASRVLRGVVAITFTEAASAEMAERVAHAFEQIRHGALPVGAHADALPAAAVRTARAAAFRLALDQLRVHTIHAFCLRLLLAHPLEAGVHPRLRVDADGQAVAAAVREVVEEALPLAFGATPDERWLRLADAEVGPREVEAALITLLGEGVAAADLAPSPAAAARAAAFPPRLAEALAALRTAEAGRLAALRSAAPALAAAVEVLYEAEEIAGRGLGLEALCAALAALPGREEALGRVRAFAAGEFGVRGAAALGEDAAEVAQRAVALVPLVTHLERLDVARYDDARAVLHALAERVETSLRRRGVATFGALLRGARDLLRNPEVRRRVRSELTQLLVDEFQDTDALQCEILRALALDEPQLPRPVLFLVGDPKQSIYGWRNADLRAYQAVRDELAGRVFPLVVNFRSAPPILDEVARLVEPVMAAEPGLQPRFEPLLASRDTRGRAGYTAGGRAPVEHWRVAQLDAETGELTEPSAEERSEWEARAAAQDLAALHAEGVPLGRTAILLRVTAAFEPVLAALREAGLPYVVERETEFYERREIVDAVALVRAVLDPLDALALVAALRSSLVGVPDAAWLPLWREGFPARAAAIDGASAAQRDEARAALRRAAAALPPDVPDALALTGWPEALDDFVCALHELRGAYERETSERFVERLRERVLLEAGEASRHLGEHRVANLDRFFRDLVLALDDAAGSAASLVAFLRRAGSVAREHAEGRPRAATDDAVNVLTIHRAKGLDWDHVYLLGVDRGHRREDRRETALLRRGADFGFVLFGAPEPGLPLLAAERADVEAAERVRLLYVATTRAKERLVVGERGGAARPWRRARHFADLLPARRGTAPDWQAVARAGAAGSGDESGVRWRVVGEAAAARAGAARAAVPLAGPAEVERDELRLRALRAEAEARMQRPLSTTASAEASARELRAAAVAGEDEPAPVAPAERRARDADARAVALAAGTAVHVLLEEGVVGADDTALARAVAVAAAPGERDAVLAHVRAVWQRFSAGPLAARLAALAPHVVARELPVWVEPFGDGPDDPVGFVAGAIDLVYRDPATGELVVADYKTDDVAGGALAERAAKYAAQGAVYTRALERALGLAARPRFELWFLRAGEVRVVPT
jgi:ATP-dependent helicase/nuclease subunit A